MPIEHERKFLVDPRKFPKSFLDPDDAVSITQHYLASKPSLRMRAAGRFLEPPTLTATMKFRKPGKRTGTSIEVELNLTASQWNALAEAPRLGTVEKDRTVCGGWEIDEFYGALSGLWLAEWEYHKGKPRFPRKLPPWIVREVTHMTCYSNRALAEHGLPKHFLRWWRRS
jgi:CYTH domain-containing protein